MSRKHVVAVAQMNSKEDRAKNLSRMETMIERASANNADIICFPEMANIHTSSCPLSKQSETLDGFTISFLKELAVKHNIWLCCGSFLETIEDSQKVYNTSVLIGRDGQIKSVYRKRHLFDVKLSDGQVFRESDRVMPGVDIVTVDTELGVLGFGICYDLRFPEHFRQMTEMGMQILLLPSSFVYKTGEAHWELLVRARAIENGCYVIAANQCKENDSYKAFGHSMIVDPWGKQLAIASDVEELLFAQVDLDYVEMVRRQLPSTVQR